MLTNQHVEEEILIAEDSPTQLIQLQYILEESGYKVVAAVNGKEALAAAYRRKPMLIISDIVMPELDGYGLCKAIKLDEKLKDIPVILVTTLSDSKDVVRGLECGADTFIRKPYDEHYLLSRIEYLLINRKFRKNQKMQMGVEIDLGGQKHFITAERQQILDLLISTYEQAIQINEEIKGREKKLAHSNQVLNGLYRIAEGLNQGGTEREVAELALERALELPGVQGGWIWLLEEKTNYRIVAARNLPLSLDTPEALESECLFQHQLLSGELNHLTNIQKYERFNKVKNDKHELRYHVSVPLWQGNRTLGVMNLTESEEGLFDEETLKVLYGVGNQVAVALERAWLYEHLEKLVKQRTAALTEEIAERKQAEERVLRLNRVYAVLSGINTTIIRVHDRQELFDEACHIAVEHGQFRMVWIGILDSKGSDLIPVATAGFEDGYLDHLKLTADTDISNACILAGSALREKIPVVSNNISTDTRMARWREEALRRNYRSMMVFPLVLNGETIGVLSLYSSEEDFFDTEEIRLLTEIAGDISFALDHLKQEEQLNYLAYFDALTGLPNRILFYDRLSQQLLVANEGNLRVVLLVIDLPRLQIINETFGRHVGDTLLKQVTKRLLDAGLDVNHLAHTGAGCFAFVLHNLQKETDILHIVEKQIIDTISRPFLVKGEELRISVKAGIALFPSDGTDAEILFRNAEMALKKANLSDDKYLFYTPNLNVRIAERLKLENKLYRALEQEQFVLHYQPKVNLKNGHIEGVEALIRWNNPDLGLVLPGNFIPLLEETGMILDIGRWALKKAMEDVVLWQERGLKPLRVAVNISPIQLRQEDFVSSVENALNGDAHKAQYLELEITESLIMHDIESNIQKLMIIQEMGVTVAIDDFGTGYSSFSYLTKLPVNTLKIDRSFIINMTNSPDDLSIIATIISLAHSLTLKVVAEGVETKEQANLLKLLKCDEIQGYLCSPAVSMEQIQQFLQKNKSLSW
ncbi:MAG: diguanylate cyclase (GGDEF) domain-containing protein [Candidatus Nitrotoga sp. SPKER]|nr:MAG: diguanylate cyclase (GGDEF) domain-containing protein [Candidatus Nitrotoga sp. SPKER]